MEDDTLENECEINIDYELEKIPAIKIKLDQIRDMQNKDGHNETIKSVPSQRLAGAQESSPRESPLIVIIQNRNTCSR